MFSVTRKSDILLLAGPLTRRSRRQPQILHRALQKALEKGRDDLYGLVGHRQNHPFEQHVHGRLERLLVYIGSVLRRYPLSNE